MKETTPSHSFLLNTEVHAVWGVFLGIAKKHGYVERKTNDERLC